MRAAVLIDRLRRAAVPPGPAALLLRAGGLAAVLVLAVAAPASAHTALDTGDPAPGATVAQLDRIRLEFATRIAPDAPRQITLAAPDGRRFDDGTVRVDGDRGLVTGVTAALPAVGEYTVRWCLVSDDGHEQHGGYVFGYAGPVDPAARPAVTAPAAVSCAPPADTASGTTAAGQVDPPGPVRADPGAEPAPGSGRSVDSDRPADPGPSVAWLVGGAVLLAAAGVAATGRTGRRRP